MGMQLDDRISKEPQEAMMSHPNGPRTGRPPTHAANGVVSTPHYLASTAGLEALQRGGSAVDAPILQAQPDTAAVFLPGGRVLRDGQRLMQADLARSFEQLATRGPREGFYEGGIAERICTGLRAHGSPLAADDFGGFEAEWVEPISTSYRGYDVVEMPPATQGFAALQLFNLLEGFDVAALGEGTADYYHHIVEAVKIAFA